MFVFHGFQDLTSQTSVAVMWTQVNAIERRRTEAKMNASKRKCTRVRTANALLVPTDTNPSAI